MTNAEGRSPTILITYPFPLGRQSAGGSRTTPTVARHLGMQGARVVLLPVSCNALNRRFPRPPVDEASLGLHLDAELAPFGVRIVRVDQHPLHFDLDACAVKRAVKRVLDEEPVDVVLGHYHEAGCLPRLLARRGIPFGYLATWQTYSILDIPRPGLHGRLRRFMERKLVIEPHRAAAVQFAISRFTEDELVRYVGVDRARIRQCPLGVDPPFLEGPRERPETIRNLLYFGRLTFAKGFLDALEALGRLAAKGVDDWVFRMFGTGRHDLARRAAERHGIADKVEVHDPVGDERLLEELARADLALMPSHFESFGLSIAEAQAAGLAVVAYHVGSVPEVVADEETGWLAPFETADRIEGLVERLERAIADPGATYETGLAARERARERFSWPRTAATLLEGIRGLT